MAVQGLLEREADLAAIEQGIEATASGDGSVLLVEGVAGIGKTELLEAARRSSQSSGMQVLAACGSELESEFAFGVVRQLFEARVARAPTSERRTLMRGAARLAAPALGLEAIRGKAADAPMLGADPMFAALHGLYWLVVNLAAGGPVLLTVDDIHWADDPSLRFLVYLARRLEGIPVLLAVARREAEPRASAELLDEIAGDENTRMLRPASLTPAAVGELLTASLSREPVAEFSDACHVATGGNPFMLKLLIRALQADDVAPAAQEVSRIEQMGATTLVRGALLGHIRFLRDPESAAGARLARAVAVLGPDAELRHAATLAGLREREAAAAADALVAAGILRPGRPLGFVHSLVRAAVHSDVPPAERALAHAEAARLLRAEGAAAERTATHLLASEPAGEPWAVDVLRTAARRAAEGGAPGSAASYLERALTEPPPREARGEVLFELGRAELASYRPAALEHLTEALAANDDPRGRSR